VSLHEVKFFWQDTDPDMSSGFQRYVDDLEWTVVREVPLADKQHARSPVKNLINLLRKFAEETRMQTRFPGGARRYLDVAFKNLNTNDGTESG